MSTLKSPYFWLILAVLALIGFLLWKRSKTVIVKPAPVAVPPAPSSINSSLAAAAGIATAATSIFENVGGLFDSDD